jgi:DNA-directed RNA polymerase
LRINQSLLPLIEKFAVELMGHDGKKLKADRRTVKADLRHARWAGNKAIYLDYSCDKRGRIYGVQQINYAREDHVRSLFEFDRGEWLSADGCEGREAMHCLEIHAANCGPGGIDKKPWANRLRWAKENTDLIERVAADPQNSFDLWRGADKPFAFVAACQELVRARKDPLGFETHLPIGFDGTCNGIQHLALLARDEKAGELVNLIDSPIPQDIYAVVTGHVMSLLESEDQRPFKKGNEWCYADFFALDPHAAQPPFALQREPLPLC